MSWALDQIIIATDDAAGSARYWQKITGMEPDRRGDPVFNLSNVSLVIEPSDAVRGLGGLVFRGAEAKPDCIQRGIPIRFKEEAPPPLREIMPMAVDVISAIDHVVIRTRDGNAAVAFFSENLGLRMALRQSVPDWGGDMIFFRTQHMSIEVIANDKAPEQDYLWGLALRCENLEACYHRLRNAGIDISDIKDGRKPGTVVATVRDAPLPLLLIGPQSPQRDAIDP